MAKGRPRDPEISRKVQEARALLAADPDRSLRSIADEVLLGADTLRYRLKRDESPNDVADGLDEAVPVGEIPVFERDYSHLPKLSVYPIGDLHIGGPGHQRKQLQEWLDYLAKTDGVSMLNTGDNTNCALKSSVSESYDEALTVEDARKAQTELFRPLAEQDKIDAIIDGNHEDRVYRATGDSPNSAVADALGINYHRAMCVVRYTVGDVQYDVYLRHGKGGGSTMGAQVNNLEKQERVLHADVYVSGHTHTQVAFVKDVFLPVPGKAQFQRFKRLFVCSGSFVGYEEYAAVAGYAPAHIGAPRIFLDGRSKDAHASV